MFFCAHFSYISWAIFFIAHVKWHAILFLVGGVLCIFVCVCVCVCASSFHVHRGNRQMDSQTSCAHKMMMREKVYICVWIGKSMKESVLFLLLPLWFWFFDLSSSHKRVFVCLFFSLFHKRQHILFGAAFVVSVFLYGCCSFLFAFVWVFHRKLFNRIFGVQHLCAKHPILKFSILCEFATITAAHFLISVIKFFSFITFVSYFKRTILLWDG